MHPSIVSCRAHHPDARRPGLPEAWWTVLGTSTRLALAQGLPLADLQHILRRFFTLAVRESRGAAGGTVAVLEPPASRGVSAITDYHVRAMWGTARCRSHLATLLAGAAPDHAPARELEMLLAAHDFQYPHLVPRAARRGAPAQVDSLRPTRSCTVSTFDFSRPPGPSR